MDANHNGSVSDAEIYDAPSSADTENLNTGAAAPDPIIDPSAVEIVNATTERPHSDDQLPLTQGERVDVVSEYLHQHGFPQSATAYDRTVRIENPNTAIAAPDPTIDPPTIEIVNATTQSPHIEQLLLTYIRRDGLRYLHQRLPQTAVAYDQDLLRQPESQPEPQDEPRLRSQLVSEVAVDFIGPMQEDSQCPICRDSLASGDCPHPTTIVHPNCVCRQQIFGRECIRQWLRDNNNCPFCVNRIITQTSPTIQSRETHPLRPADAVPEHTAVGVLARPDSPILDWDADFNPNDPIFWGDITADMHLPPPPVPQTNPLRPADAVPEHTAVGVLAHPNFPIFDWDADFNFNEPVFWGDDSEDEEFNLASDESEGRQSLIESQRTRIYEVASSGDMDDSNFWNTRFSELFLLTAGVTEIIAIHEVAFSREDLSVLMVSVFRAAALALSHRDSAPASGSTDSSAEDTTEGHGHMYDLLLQNTAAIRARLEAINFTRTDAVYRSIENPILRRRMRSSIETTRANIERITGGVSVSPGLETFEEQARRDFLGSMATVDVDDDSDGNAAGTDGDVEML